MAGGPARRKAKLKGSGAVDVAGGPERGPEKRQATASSAPPGDLEEIYAALVLGARDYVNKNGFKEVVLGERWDRFGDLACIA